MLMNIGVFKKRESCCHVPGARPISNESKGDCYWHKQRPKTHRRKEKGLVFPLKNLGNPRLFLTPIWCCFVVSRNFYLDNLSTKLLCFRITVSLVPRHRGLFNWFWHQVVDSQSSTTEEFQKTKNTF